MPIVINELVFKGAIAPESEPKRPAQPAPPPVDQRELVQACVEEVMRILAREQER